MISAAPLRPQPLVSAVSVAAKQQRKPIMSKPLHSPTPWHHFDHCEGHSINDANGHHVAYTDWDSEGFDTENAPADKNAAFIVAACNAHVAMLEALELAVDVLEFDCHVDSSSGDYMDAIHSGKAAIALAKSGN